MGKDKLHTLLQHTHLRMCGKSSDKEPPHMGSDTWHREMALNLVGGGKGSFRPGQLTGASVQRDTISGFSGKWHH